MSIFLWSLEASGHSYGLASYKTGVRLEITNPKCVGEEGRIRLIGEDNTKDIHYSFSGEIFYPYQAALNLEVGVYQLLVKQEKAIRYFNFSIMPDEEISFEFINIEPANCIGQGGRIQAAITGSGTAQQANTGSGTILFNSRSFGREIDVEVDAGRYTLTAFLTEDIRVDTTFFVTQETCEVYVPNAFNPRSTEGLNKRFVLGFSTETNPIINTYTIYDRWGSLVYERNNIEANQFTEWWDGSCFGEPCDPGIYVYKINVSFETGDSVDRIGTLTLF
jgi:hypothetical protein